MHGPSRGARRCIPVPSSGIPLSCATALAFLDVLEEREASRPQPSTLGDHIVSRLKESLSTLACVRQIRGRGLLIGIELCSEDGGPAPGGGARVAEAALSQGLLVSTGRRSG